MRIMTLNASNDNWYMDISTTSYMTASQSNLTSYFNMSKNKNIIVGSGHEIPIHGLGQTHLPPYPPLTLKNVLHAPKLIKNLIFVHRFTTYNHVSVEFNPFGFLVKDIQTGMRIIRCDSTGDLYPIPITTISQALNPSTFAALSPDS